MLEKLSTFWVRSSLPIQNLKMQDASLLIPLASGVRCATWEAPERTWEVLTQRSGDCRDSILAVGSNSAGVNVELLGTVAETGKQGPVSGGGGGPPVTSEGHLASSALVPCLVPSLLPFPTYKIFLMYHKVLR